MKSTSSITAAKSLQLSKTFTIKIAKWNTIFSGKMEEERYAVFTEAISLAINRQFIDKERFLSQKEKMIKHGVLSTKLCKFKSTEVRKKI